VSDYSERSDRGRRRYLKRLAAASTPIVLGSIAGCSQSDSRTASSGRTSVGPIEEDSEAASKETRTSEQKTYPYESAYDRVVDVAAEGGDDTGKEPVNSIIESNLDDDTLFYFDEGSYLLKDTLVVQDHSNVGFVGRNATIRPQTGDVGIWINVDNTAGFRFEGFVINNTASHTAVQMRVHVAGGRNLIRNVDVRGFHDVPIQTYAFTIQVGGEETMLELRDVDMSDGAMDGIAVYVHPHESPGTLVFRDCHVEGWNEQGLYGSSHGGPLYVLGGRYANNGTAQVRVGGGNIDTEAVIRDVTVEISDPKPAKRKQNIRGIWLHEGDGTTVENCEVSVSSLSEYGSDGGIVISSEHGRATIRDTTVQMDASAPGIIAVRPRTSGFVIPSLERPPDAWTITVEGTRLSGNASENFGLLAIDRPRSTFTDLEIVQEGEERNGIGFIRSPGIELRGLTCDTPKYPLLSDFKEHTGCNLRVAGVQSIESEHASEAESTLSSEQNGTYCISDESVGTTDERPVVGVVGHGDEGLYLQLVSKDEIKYY
jgi:hypothetical protein